jgi:VWFA-related protein
MKARALLALGLLLACSMSVGGRQASLQLIDIAVEAADGTPVTGLTAENFQLEVAGAPRPIESFATARPLSLVLLFDITTSVETMIKRGVLRDAFEKYFIKQLRPDDRVQVGSLGRTIKIGPPIAGNPRALLSAVQKALDPEDADTHGPSPMWDAIDAAVTALAPTTGRRAVILVSDGRATGNRLSPEDVGLRAVAAGVTVSVVGEDWEMTIRQNADTGVRVRPGAGLQWIAGTTGGLYVPDHATDPAPGTILERLLGELHDRYTLGFTPHVRDGKVHALNVRVNRPGLTLRARRTILAPAN